MLRSSRHHFIFNIREFLLEFTTRCKHDVHALDVLLGERSLRSCPFAFQRCTERAEFVQSDAVAFGKMPGQAIEDIRQYSFYHTAREKAGMLRYFLYEVFIRHHLLRHTLCINFPGRRSVEHIAQRENTIPYHNDELSTAAGSEPLSAAFPLEEDEVFPLAASRSTLLSPAFSAFRVAACAMRLLTTLNVARERRFWKSSPGVNTMLTVMMLFSVNFFRLSAPSEVREIQKLPNSASCTFLPSRSIFTRHSHMSEITPFTVPRVNTPLWSAMCFTKFPNEMISEI